MLNDNWFSHVHPNSGVARFGLSAWRIVFVAFLIIVSNLLPFRSFSQPLANGRSKFLGCSTSANIWPNLDKYWNQITPGNDGKWGSLEQVQGYYTWDNLDNIYTYAISRGFLFKEHNLVWGQQQPIWITSLDSADQRAAVKDWIQHVCQRYDSLSFIDVVNEPFHAPPPYMNALGGSGITGWDWVVTAFQWARQYATPGTKLLLNDYNILQDNSVTTKFINLIDTLKVRGLIDGIGIQGHYFEFRSQVHATSNVYVYNVNTLKSNLDRIVTATGLPVYISEFDVDEPNDTDQLAEYQIYFPIFWDDPGVKGMTLWGYIQNDVWDAHPNTFLLRTDGTERPALQWVRNYIKKGPVPVPPALVSPLSTTNTPKRPTYTWQSALHAATFELQVALDNAFQLVLVDTMVADTVATPSAVLDDTTVFYWHVCGIDSAGAGPFSSAGHFTTGTLLAVKDVPSVLRDYSLSQNYPNPFNPTTEINYQISVNSLVTLKVYDVLGREIRTLVNALRNAGAYTAQFDGTGLPSGVYFYRIRAGNFTDMKKLVLMK